MPLTKRPPVSQFRPIPSLTSSPIDINAIHYPTNDAARSEVFRARSGSLGAGRGNRERTVSPKKDGAKGKGKGKAVQSELEVDHEQMEGYGVYERSDERIIQPGTDRGSREMMDCAQSHSSHSGRASKGRPRTSSMDSPMPSRSLKNFRSTSTLPPSYLTHSSIALSRSVSHLSSNAPQSIASSSRPLLDPPFSPPLPRKLVKRRPSVIISSSSGPTGQIHHPGKAITSPSPDSLTRKPLHRPYISPTSPTGLPFTFQTPFDDPGSKRIAASTIATRHELPLIDPPVSAPSSSSAALSRNGSSSTSTSLDPTSTSCESSAGPITPREDDIHDGLPNRHTFGPIYDDDYPPILGRGGDIPQNLQLLEVGDESGWMYDEEDEEDFRPPRFWADSTTSSLGKDSQSSTTSSSGRTIQPQTEVRRVTPPSLLSAVSHGPPPDPPPLPNVCIRPLGLSLEVAGGDAYRIPPTSRRTETDAVQRLPSIYDFSEILRACPSPLIPLSPRPGSHPTRHRASSVGTISDWTRALTRTLDEISAEEQEIRNFLSTRDPPSVPSSSSRPPAARAPRSSRHTRRAPAPPHLVSALPAAGPLPIPYPPPIPPSHGPSSDKARGDFTAVLSDGADESHGPPSIPERTSSLSLGLIWRRLSGRARASQRGRGRTEGGRIEAVNGDTSELSDLESPQLDLPVERSKDHGRRPGSGSGTGGIEQKSRERRSGLIRALSRRRTDDGRPHQKPQNGDDQVYEPPMPIPKTPFRRHLSVPPPRTPVNLSSFSTESISTGWTELPPQIKKPPLPPLPQLRIPHRHASLPPPKASLPIADLAYPTPHLPPFGAVDISVPQSLLGIDIITPSFSASPLETLSERNRRFRRTLVEIEDDVQFQRTLQDEDGGVTGKEEKVEIAFRGNERASTSSLVQEIEEASGLDEKLGKSEKETEKEVGKHTIQAWFVTRELVQGEKRYGRLLARGVSIVQLIAERETLLPLPSSPSDFGPPIPTSSSLSSFFSSSTGMKRSSKPPHSFSSSPPSTLNVRRISASSITTSAHSQSATTPSNPLSASCPSPSTNSVSPVDIPPLTILLHRLPRLLALSITLSSRFAHDPSPEQIAIAFLSMEDELLAEMSEWAGEVGQLIAMGYGEVLDREMRDDMGSLGNSRSSMFEYPTPGSSSTLSRLAESSGPIPPSPKSGNIDKEERISFSEILLAPVQRAARYRLLFGSLLAKMPKADSGGVDSGLRPAPEPGKGSGSGSGRDKVQLALWAAERIVQGVNRGQGFDLEGLRRVSGGDGVGGGEGVVLIPRKRAGRGSAGRRVRSMYT